MVTAAGSDTLERVKNVSGGTTARGRRKPLAAAVTKSY